MELICHPNHSPPDVASQQWVFDEIYIPEPGPALQAA